MSSTLAKINALADSYIKADKLATAAANKLKELEKSRDALEEELRQRLVEDKVESHRTKGYNFTPGERDILETKDWDQYWAWARKDKLGVYVQRRPAVKAVYEQLDAGKEVPGVLRGKLKILHVTKAK